MGIWENLGMGGYRGFSRPAARLLQQAVQQLQQRKPRMEEGSTGLSIQTVAMAATSVWEERPGYRTA